MELTLWTLQAVEKWEEFQKTGILTATTEYATPEFLDSYSWMCKKLQEKSGTPPDNVMYPIWAWHCYKQNKKKPDLRCAGHFMPGTPAVRIEFTIDHKDVLLTDFSDWHIILGTGSQEERYNECSELDLEDFDEPDEIEFPWLIKGDKIHMPWENIILEPDVTGKSIQAVLWQVKMEQVRKVTHFRAR